MNSQYHDDYIATHEIYKERMGNVITSPLGMCFNWNPLLMTVDVFSTKSLEIRYWRETWICLSNVSTNVTPPRQYTARVHTQYTEMATSVCANKMCTRYNAISIVHVRLGFNIYLVLCVPFPALWCLTIYLVCYLVRLQFNLV